MSLRLTRRSWVMAIGAAPLLAQAPAQPVPATPEQRGEKAKSEVRQASDTLAKLNVPMDTEPAFRFVA